MSSVVDGKLSMSLHAYLDERREIIKTFAKIVPASVLSACFSSAKSGELVLLKLFLFTLCVLLVAGFELDRTWNTAFVFPAYRPDEFARLLPLKPKRSKMATALGI